MSGDPKDRKRKHNSLSIAKKVELLRKLEKGTSVLNLCKEYNVGKSTIYDLQKRKGEIMKFFIESDVPSAMEKRKTMHTAKNEDLDKVMIEWFRQRRSENVPLTGTMLMEQAKSFHNSMNLDSSVAYSTGWLRNFKKRHGIRQLSICGERVAADHEAAENYITEFEEIVKNLNLTPDQIYNADESSLFWRYLPRKSLCAGNEKAPSGIKDAKDRITILACANAAGSHKLKLLVIGKYGKPRALKNATILPVHYKFNKRAWITQEITKDWFENHFIPEARAHCASVGLPQSAKIILILDNCAAHPPAEQLEKENVLVLYLPPNCTSILQPMDMGVLRALKCRYKSDFVKGLLQFLNSQSQDVVSYLKQFTIKDAIWNVARAWENITCDILKNAWHNLWPLTLFLNDDDTDSNFEGFNTKKNDVTELLEYAKSIYSDKINLEEDDLNELMDVDNDAPVTNRLTDGEILNSALSLEEDSETEDEIPELESKMPIDNLIDVMDTAIKELEKRNFITEHELMSMYKIKEKLLNEKPKLRQKT